MFKPFGGKELKTQNIGSIRHQFVKMLDVKFIWQPLDCTQCQL